MKRLRKLRLTRVDLVPAGANPGAHIKLFKAATKSEDGKQFPASDYAYVPEADKPSTWKLRLTSEPGGQPDPRIVGAAVAALGKGFRGQTVNVPADALSSVKTKVLRAWKKAHQDMDSTQVPEVLKMESESVKVDELQKVQKELEEAKSKLADAEKAKDAESKSVRKALEDTRAELDAIRKDQRSRDFAEKAKNEYQAIGDAAQIGRILEAADSHFDEADKAAFSTILKSAAEQVEKGSLFKRLSRDAEEPQTWEAKLAQAARDRVAKGQALTVEQAKVQIMSEDKELRREYANSRKVS